MSAPILIVDDQAAMSRLLRRILEDLDFGRVDEANNGSLALSKLREHLYRLVISDLKMEPMSGMDLLRHVRADAQLRSLPFIMLTGVNDTEQFLEAKRHGVNDYILKPFTTQTVLKKITNVLQQPAFQGP